MFENVDPELAAMLAWDDAVRAELPDDDEVPDWVIAELPASELSAGQRIDRLVDLERRIARLQAEQTRVLAAIDRADGSKEHCCQEAVMCALRVSASAAQTRLKTARTLTDELPRTLGLLESGSISVRQAELIADASWKLEADVTTEFESLVLDRACEQSLPELKRSLKRAAVRVDPATAETRHQRAREDRCVRRTALEDGMAELRLIATADNIETAWLRLDAGVRLLPAQDPRTRDQQRADLLIDAILTGIPFDALPELQGRRPAIQVVVAADTLLTLDDQPGHLAGYGAITAHTARRLAAEKDATWRRLLTDPDTGHLLDYGRTTYRPPQALIDFVLTRDSVCFFPSCNQPGYLCDVDHVLPWDDGGDTCPGNTAPGCRRHHNSKTHHGWRYTLNPDGSFTTTAPTGHTYTSRPPQRWNTDRGDPPTWEQKIHAAQHESEAAQRAREDREHATYEKLLTTELERAHTAQDHEQASKAQTALTNARQHREHQLRGRTSATPSPSESTAYPNEPPF
jgi:hypothetical protein